jgi:hypothetical protein
LHEKKKVEFLVGAGICKKVRKSAEELERKRDRSKTLARLNAPKMHPGCKKRIGTLKRKRLGVPTRSPTRSGQAGQAGSSIQTPKALGISDREGYFCVGGVEISRPMIPQNI